MKGDPRKRGSIFVEALVAVPTIAVILVALLGLSAMYSAKLEAKGRARRLAWLQADSGDCPPMTCASAECRKLDREVALSGLGEFSGSNHGRFSLDSFVGDVRRFFVGGVTRGVGNARARLPAWFGADTTTQSGVSALLCNTSTRHASTGGSVLDHACGTGLETMEYASAVCR